MSNPISTNIYVIAAICGNFWQESTVNPGIWEGLTVGAPGYGLGQWTDNPPVVMRRSALFNWLSQNGYSQDSGDGQLAFLVHEDLWIPSLFTPSAYSTMSDFFSSTSTSLSELVREWMYHWEGIDDGSYQNRYDAAWDYLETFRHPPAERNPWYSSNAYNSVSQARSNALRIMDFFLGEEPTPPGPGPEPTEEELVALMRAAMKNKRKGGVFILW